MAKPFRLDRRTLLTGAGSAALALPLLDVMGDEVAHAAPGDHRFVIAFGGVSLFNSAVPSDTGASYGTTPAFAPLEPLRDKLMLVSGLDIPANGAKGDADATPLGGRPQGPFHNNSVDPILTGCRSGLGPTLSHITADQAIADAWQGRTPTHSLQLRVQADAYVGGYGNMSATSGGAPLPPIANPLVAYETLFSSFTPSTPGAVTGQTLAQRRSILDVVDRRAGRLMDRVSAADRVRLERHYDEIRALEGRLVDVMNPGGACALPPSPTVPPIGSLYSNEDARGRLMADMLQMAFVCDLTRVASFMITFAQCQMSAQALVGVDFACHELTHSVAQRALGAAGRDKWAEMNAWHVDQFGYLAQRLDEVSLLDNTTMVLLFEAGTTSSHSTTNMVAAVFGRGDRLRLGEHVDAQGARPAQLLQTLMEINGVDQPFGEVPGTISGVLI